MPPKKDRTKQASVDPEDYENQASEGSIGETGGEMITTTPTTSLNISFIPELSGASLTSLITLFQGILTTELDRRFESVNNQ